MKSNVIWIDNHGKGFPDVIKEAHKVAVYEEIEEKKFLQIQLLTEEMLSMVLSLDEIQASFWFECRNGRCDLHLTTRTVLDKEKRNRLISSTSTGKNAAANTFLGRLRDRFENAMASGGNQTYDDLSAELKRDMSHSARGAHEWDGYERSIIRNVADDVKISIQNGLVDMTISKKYA